MRIYRYIYSQWGLLAVFTIAIGLLLYLTYIKYHTGVNELQQQINPAFKIAIAEEVETRFARCDTLYIYIKLNSGNTPRKHFIFETEEGIDTIHIPADIHLYEDYGLLNKQRYLYENCEPLNADSLNCYFNRAMRRMGNKVFTEVVLTRRRTHDTFSSNVTFQASDFKFQSDVLVIDNRLEYEVQAFANFPFSVILLHGSWTLVDFMILSVVFLAIIAIVLILYKKKRDEKRRNLTTIHFGKLTFDTARRKIKYGSEETEVRVQLAQLLMLFLEAPDHILTKEEIKLHFWPHNAYQTDSKIHNLIVGLRQICKIDPTIRIESIPQKGYQLVW